MNRPGFVSCSLCRGTGNFSIGSQPLSGNSISGFSNTLEPTIGGSKCGACGGSGLARCMNCNGFGFISRESRCSCSAGINRPLVPPSRSILAKCLMCRDTGTIRSENGCISCNPNGKQRTGLI